MSERSNETVPLNNETVQAFTELRQSVYAAMETYSNVHRGSGYNSMVTTYLFEKARDIILEYLGLNKSRFVIIFCTSRAEESIRAQLLPGSYHTVSSLDHGLPLGVRALAVKREMLTGRAPFQSGGGTTKLISKEWIIWADAPDKFEAGTPAIINIIAFARALTMIREKGKELFFNYLTPPQTPGEILYNDELDKYHGQELLDELRKTLIGRDLMVPSMHGPVHFINLDNSASTPTFTPVLNAFYQTLFQPVEVKQQIIQEVRNIIAGALGATLTKYDIIFTSNTTEAINLVAESLKRETEEGIEPVLLSTLFEHSSNDLPWRMVNSYSMIRLKPDDEGFIDLKEMEVLMSGYNREGKHGNKRIRFVAVSGASNVLGVCNNLEEIGRIAHQFGAKLLVDAAQLVAHRKINMEACGIDYLAFSAHKVYAPFGCGVLIFRKGLLNFSSTEMDLIRFSGEENAGGIAALGKAIVLLQRIGMALIREEEQALTARALSGMGQIEGLRIFGVKNSDSPGFGQKLGVILFSMKSMMPSRVAGEMAIRGGIGVRSGCHCAHIIIKHLLNMTPSLERFQRFILAVFPKVKFPGLVRVSLGIETSEEDIDTMINVLSEIAKKGPPVVAERIVQKQLDDSVKAVARRVYS